eukprot:m.270441 g.270441  ORF g.270441 m.270441 type:complete len:149 (+) comp39307_c0_seq1:110-556(+)
MFARGPDILQGQVGVLRMLAAAIASGVLDRFLGDPDFAATFDYAIADMNTQCVHAMQYVKHALIAATLRAAGLPASALMEPALEEAFYTYYLGPFVDSWGLGDRVTPTVRQCLRALCEDSSLDYSALIQLCEVHGAPLPAAFLGVVQP